jgi:hypothetical protein
MATTKALLVPATIVALPRHEGSFWVTYWQLMFQLQNYDE